MANNAVVGVLRALLTANTAQYDQAFKKSTVITGQFGKATEQLTEQSKRMAAAFSGDKLIARANNLTAAVNKIGGATRLTEAEQRRVNATLTEAIAKYTALGQKAPAAMLATEKATRQVDVATSKWGGTLTQARSVLAAFGFTISTAAVVSFAKALLDTADALVRVSDRTGLTTTEVQKLQFIAEQSGNSIDDFTGAIGQLQNRLIGGDKNAVRAVEFLKINLEALKTASPFEQLSMIARALSDIEDPAIRARVAFQLFGRAGMAILPTLIADFDKLAKSAPLMADATVRALDVLGDQLNQARQQMMAWGGEFFVFLSGLLDKAIAAAARGLAAIFEFQAKLVALASKIPGVGKLYEMLGITVDGLRQNAQFLRDTADGLNGMLERQAAQVKKNTGTMQEYDESLLEAAGSTKKLKDETKELLPETFELWRIVKVLAPAIDDNNASQQISNQLVNEGLDGVVAYTDELKNLTAELQKAGMAQFDFSAHIDNKASQEAAQITRDQQEEVREGWRRVFNDIGRNLTMSISDSLADMVVGLRSFKEGFLDIWRSIQRAFSNILASMLDQFVEGFIKGMLRAIGAARIGESLINNLTGGGGGGGLTQGLTKLAGSALPGLGGGAAAGGAFTTVNAAGAAVTPGLAGAMAPGAAPGAVGAGGGAGALGFLSNPAFWTNPYTIAIAATAAVLTWGITKKGWFRGGEEGVKVNPRRDKFQMQFARGGENVAQAGMRLAAQLTKWSGQPGGGPLFSAMQRADSVKEWESAQRAIVAEFAKHGTGLKSFAFGGFVPPGSVQPAILHGGGMGELIVPIERLMRQHASGSPSINNYNFAIRALDSQDVKQFLEREFWPRHNREMMLNQYGGASSIRKAGRP